MRERRREIDNERRRRSDSERCCMLFFYLFIFFFETAAAADSEANDEKPKYVCANLHSSVCVCVCVGLCVRTRKRRRWRCAVCLPADDRPLWVEGVYHVTIEPLLLLLLLLSTVGGDDDGVARRTRVKPTMMTKTPRRRLWCGVRACLLFCFFSILF